jgi:methyl-accepting chemotaxis protein-1 (serine sensor receptor)
MQSHYSPVNHHKNFTMKNISIKFRLIITMGFMGVMLVIGGLMGVLGLQAANNTLMNVYANQMASSSDIQIMMVRLLQARAALNRVAMRPDEAGAEESIKRAESFYAQSEDYWQKYLALPMDPGSEKPLADEVTQKRAEYLKDAQEGLTAALRAKQVDVVEDILLKRLSASYQSLLKSTDALVDYQNKTAAAGYDDSQLLYSRIRMAAILGVLAGLLAVAISAWMLIRAINGPLREMLAHFDAISSGDLTQKIEVGSRNEMGMLMLGLQKMQTQLTSTVARVREGSSSISTATTQIAAGNLDLSSRTEQQAASLEETASSMEELTSTVKQNADNARQANQLAISASDVAVRGGGVVSQVVTTMASIDESAKRIVDIISVIDGIAFQTNILALNAAVEAARAGEQGRGFAVVASEVRSLAQRSASAAKEIKSLIDDSVDKVDTGSRLVAQAGTTMAEIVDSVKHVTDIMGEILAASQEQSAGIEQVNTAIGQMDEVTQQNAALVEEAAAAAASLKEQAANLSITVSVFKLSGHEVQGFTPSAVEARPRPKSLPTAVRTAPVRKPVAVAKRIASPKAVPAISTSGDGDWEQF